MPPARDFFIGNEFHHCFFFEYPQNGSVFVCYCVFGEMVTIHLEGSLKWLVK